MAVELLLRVSYRKTYIGAHHIGRATVLKRINVRPEVSGGADHSDHAPLRERLSLTARLPRAKTEAILDDYPDRLNLTGDVPRMSAPHAVDSSVSQADVCVIAVCDAAGLDGHREFLVDCASRSGNRPWRHCTICWSKRFCSSRIMSPLPMMQTVYRQNIDVVAAVEKCSMRSF